MVTDLCRLDDAFIEIATKVEDVILSFVRNKFAKPLPKGMQEDRPDWMLRMQEKKDRYDESKKRIKVDARMTCKPQWMKRNTPEAKKTPWAARLDSWHCSRSEKTPRASQLELRLRVAPPGGTLRPGASLLP